MKFILSIILLIPFCVLSQKHEFTYDASGNRIKREYVVTPIQAPDDGSDQSAQARTSKANLIDDSTSNSVVIKAYPNPFSDQVTISLETEEDLKGNERIIIYSETGQLIQEINMTQKTKTIQTQDLANGKYILQLFRNEESQQFLLIKN